MHWDRRQFLGASLLTAALPSAKLIASGRLATTGTVLNFEDAGGSINNSGSKNNRAYISALRYLTRRGGGTLLIPQKVYPFDGTAYCSATNVTVSGYGATFAGNNCRLAPGDKSSGYNIEGLTLVETSGASGTFLLDCYASGSLFKEMHLEKRPPAGGYIGYCRDETSGNAFQNVSFSGSNGFYLAGHDHQINGGWGDSHGHDDCWAIKALNAPCYNIQISGFQARGFAALVSIGSEIGALGVDDPTHAMFVRNVLVQNCSAEACAYLAYIKPGAITQYDYRDGLVENVSILNCQVQDPSGTHFRNGVYISPGKGAIVRSVTVKDVAITARGASPAVQSVSGLYLRTMGTVDGAGQGGSIEHISVTNLQCTDPYGGAATAASAPGVPLHSLIAIEKLNSGIGQIGQVQISDSAINGCARMGVALGPGVVGPVSLGGCTLQNFAAAILGSADKGSVAAHSPIHLSNITAIPSPTAPTDTRGVLADADPDKTIEYFGDLTQISLTSVAAGSDLSSPIYSSTRDSWISKVEITADEPIPQSTIDFVRFTLRNGGNGEILGSASSANGFLSAGGTPGSINGAVQFSGAAAALLKGAQLMLEITQGGNGAEIVNPTVVVHSVPYGTA